MSCDDLSAINVADREAQRRARQEQAEAAEAMAAANKEMEDEEAAAQEVQEAEAKLKQAEEDGLSAAIVQHLRVLAANKRKEFRVRPHHICPVPPLSSRSSRSCRSPFL